MVQGYEETVFNLNNEIANLRIQLDETESKYKVYLNSFELKIEDLVIMRKCL